MNIRGFDRRPEKSKKLRFTSVNYVPPEDRQYGLMAASSDKASTPHPKKWKTNLSTLNMRLEDVKLQQKSEPKEFSTYEDMLLVKETLNSELVDRVKALPEQQASFSYRGILRISATTPLSADKSGERQTKKVIFSPEDYDFNFFKLRPSAKTDDPQSFHERRRLFHEAEFTIAKHGKKMSDVFIVACNQNLTDIAQLDEIATRQLETIVAEHGFVHGAMGVLTADRPLKSITNRR